LLWYGKNTVIDFKKIYKRRKLRHVHKLRRNAMTIATRVNYSVTPVLVSTPPCWDLAILSNTKSNDSTIFIYFYNDLYYFKFVLTCSNSLWGYDPSARIITSLTPYKSHFFLWYIRSMSLILHSLISLFFRKLKLRGKGYYVYKTARNTITHQLNHSHRTYIYSYYTYVKFLSKTSFLFFGLSKKDIFKVTARLKSSRPVNIFTGRGVRFAQQVVYKKTGKVSAYR
jgi:hypothetical protein